MAKGNCLDKLAVGQRHGKWTVLELPSEKSQHPKILCHCDCGKDKLVDARSVLLGMSKNCGCVKGKKAAERLHKHGRTDTTEHVIWLNMRYRCCKPDHKAYKWYGARGIKVCDRWLDSFENFYADMGPRPEGLSLDRIDVNGDYEPSNCRWATAKEQARNSRWNRMVTIGGETKCIAAWMEHFGLSKSTYESRRRYGWPEEKALSTPPLTKFRARPKIAAEARETAMTSSAHPAEQ